MRRYLSTLHKRSPRHKKNFSLFVAGGTTLLMFGLWYTLNYGAEPVVVAEAPATRELPAAAAHEVGPFESISASAGQGWQELRASFTGFLDSLNSVDVEQGYEEMQNKTLDTYGR